MLQLKGAKFVNRENRYPTFTPIIGAFVGATVVMAPPEFFFGETL